MPRIRPLQPTDVSLVHDERQLAFDSTLDLEPLETLIGQDRAVEAIDFALRVENAHFNLFVTGLPGTGKMTLVPEMCRQVASKRETPPDILFVHNFKAPEKPRALTLPAGRGRSFVADVRKLIEQLRKQMPAALATRDYRSLRQEIIEKAVDARREHLTRLETRARELGFLVEDTPESVELRPVDAEGNEIPADQWSALPDEQRATIEANERTLRDDLLEYVHAVKEIEDEGETDVEQLERGTVKRIVSPAVDRLRRRYAGADAARAWLGELAEDVIERREAFLPSEEPVPLFGPRPAESSPQERYEVNLVVDNAELEGAPVVVEHNPTWANVVGRVEHRMRFGVLESDHTMLRAGSFVRANGGFLVIHCRDLLSSPFLWNALKRCLRESRVTIEEPEEMAPFVNSVGVKPEPLDVRTRVVLLGSLDDYIVLSELDDDFSRLFKVRADFDDSAPLTPEIVHALARHVAARCRRSKLLPVARSGIAALVEHATRVSGERDRVSLELASLNDLLVEADYWARRDDHDRIDRACIEAVTVRRRDRDGLFRDRLLREFEHGSLLVEVRGRRVGQVNGLSVISIGDVSFGFPTRITAKTYAGGGGITNIERETELSGQIHSKATLILHGWLCSLFAQDVPLSISASITFEQNYGFVEGDSASVAEAVALLSSISGAAIRQDLAVTGSMSQHGEVQPVGGVNEKVEGFFEVCRLSGLTGTQGVLVPERNVRELNLRPDVVAAIRDGAFHVWPIRHIDDAIELLTGVRAGRRKSDGTWAPRTLNGRVQARLREVHRRNEGADDARDDLSADAGSDGDATP